MQIEKLYPECKDYLWGGNKLKTSYHKITEKTPCAESWELSFHKDGMTRLCGGETLAARVGRAELGDRAAKFPVFPVLTKFIDAKENLSMQVHPSDEYALRYENSLGKTEMWYVVEATAGAGLYLGFNRDVTKSEYEQAIRENRLTELLNFYEVQAGDCYFIPAGTIHAIGAGCLIYEIQQNSNVTYRVYDYGRKGKDGKERELHIDKALAVTNLQQFTPLHFSDCLGKCAYFTAQKYMVRNALTLRTDGGSFHCVTCVQGEGRISGQPILQGDSYFIPANFGEYTLEGDMEIVRTLV